ncbi:MAG: hypothetical protein ABIK85_02095 [Candidatus Eisenbacteria bacterium]
MRSKHLVIASIVLFGSLWGLVELAGGEIMWARDIPRAPLLTAIGVIFLVLGRRLWAAPGSSLALAAVASAFKFLQHPVWGCKIAAVLMVGAIFDIGFSLYEARQRRQSASFARAGTRSVLVLSPTLTFLSFILFSYFARDVLNNPYWASPSKMTDYMFVQGPVAAVLAIPAALAGLRLSSYLTRSPATWSDGRLMAYRIAAAGSGVAGIAAALALRY